MMKKQLLILTIFMLPEFGCIPVTFVPEPIETSISQGSKKEDPRPGNPVQETKPVSSPIIETGSSLNQQNPVIITLPNNLVKISINPLNIKEVNPGSVIKITGSNFIAGKLSKIIFVNENGKEFNAEIITKSDNEISLKVPVGTEVGLTKLYEVDNKSFHSGKIYVLPESGEKISFANLNIIIKYLESTGSSSSTSTEPPTTVSVNFNAEKPQKAVE